MHIKKIVKDSLNDFPELIENGYNEVDLYRLWMFYENELVNYLINPDKPYLKLFHFGSLGLTVRKLEKRIIGFEKIDSINNTLMPLNPEKTIRKLESIKEHIDAKRKHYEAVVEYLDGYDTGRAKQSVKVCGWKIERLNNLTQRTNSLINKNVERITTRDLEKQISNS